MNTNTITKLNLMKIECRPTQISTRMILFIVITNRAQLFLVVTYIYKNKRILKSVVVFSIRILLITFGYNQNRWKTIFERGECCNCT